MRLSLETLLKLALIFFFHCFNISCCLESLQSFRSALSSINLLEL